MRPHEFRRLTADVYNPDYDGRRGKWHIDSVRAFMAGEPFVYMPQTLHPNYNRDLPAAVWLARGSLHNPHVVQAMFDRSVPTEPQTVYEVALSRMESSSSDALLVEILTAVLDKHGIPLSEVSRVWDERDGEQA